MEKEYKRFLIKHQLTDKKIGDILGYANRQSWNGAKVRPKVIQGLLQLVKLIQKRNEQLEDVGYEFVDWVQTNYQPGPNQGTWYDKDFKGNLDRHVPYTTKQIWRKFKKQY